ncbi:AbrB family transcriptional regulator [Tabrizicola sp. WMC-M-20]|nr:AbrB family transcriptional regulator [Tabrizicola sp. WMC-M-20]
MLTKDLAPYITALAIGGGGGILALGSGLPAAALIGATLAVSLAATLGFAVKLHIRLRDLAFTVIGVSLGAGVEREVLAQIGSWSVSLLMLLASLGVTVALGTILLERWFRIDRETAVLASSPGTMSYALALAAEGRGDVTVILILQVIRLVLLVALVPPMALMLESEHVTSTAVSMAALPLALVVTVSLGVGLVLTRAGLPAACLLVGMIFSAIVHVTGLGHGAAPEWAVNASFVVAGTALGARLENVSPKVLLRLSGAGLLLVASAVVVSVVFATLTYLLTGVPLAQAWIAFAPGAVEAMAAIGLALGYDPAYVAAHHFVRILALFLAIPLFLKFLRTRP